MSIIGFPVTIPIIIIAVRKFVYHKASGVFILMVIPYIYMIVGSFPYFYDKLAFAQNTEQSIFDKYNRQRKLHREEMRYKRDRELDKYLKEKRRQQEEYERQKEKEFDRRREERRKEKEEYYRQEDEYRRQREYYRKHRGTWNYDEELKKAKDKEEFKRNYERYMKEEFEKQRDYERAQEEYERAQEEFEKAKRSEEIRRQREKNRFYGMSLEEAKKLYRELIKQVHPDDGGSNEETVKLNAEFAEFKNNLAK